MKNYNGCERRKAPRINLNTFCPASFIYKGKQLHALMVNLNELGAGFQIEKYNQRITLEKGQELILNIRTPYGDSKCVGKIIWTSEIDEHFRWGVQFVKLSEKKDDPLRTLINSPF